MYAILNAYLGNGLQIVMHRMKDSRTFSCGLWVKQGSKHENEDTSGYSHLIEHLLISKDNSGNKKLKYQFDEISNNGVIYNAGTTKEATSYYFSGIVSELDRSLMLLADIVKEKRDISKTAFINEKKVVVQEAVSFYSSFNQIKERSSQALWGNASVGRPIIGSIQNIERADYKQISKLIEKSYTPSNSILVVVGNIDYDDCLDKVETYFSEWEDRACSQKIELVDNDAGIFYNHNKSSSSSVISVCFRTPSFLNESRIPISIISKILGDSGLSSRMMKKIRAEAGLSYITGSFVNTYGECGTLGMTSVCNHDDVYEVLDIVKFEIQDILRHGFLIDELNRSKKVLETQTLMSLGSVEAQMKFIAKNAVYGHLFSLESELRAIQRICIEDINNSAQAIFSNSGLGFAGIGAFSIDKVVQSLTIDEV